MLKRRRREGQKKSIREERRAIALARRWMIPFLGFSIGGVSVNIFSSKLEPLFDKVLATIVGGANGEIRLTIGSLVIWITAITFLVLIIFLREQNNQRKRINAKLGTLLQIDDYLILLVKDFLSVGPPEISVEKQSIQRILRKTTTYLGAFAGDCEACIYRLDDPGIRQYITPWLKTFNYPEADSRYYIQNKEGKRSSTPGFSFIDKKVYKIYLQTIDNLWIQNEERDEFNFSFLEEGFEAGNIYRSFIYAPLINEHHDSIGVVCFCSKKQHAFDSGQVEEVIAKMAERISLVLSFLP